MGPQILIDRELLQQILDEVFDLEAENRAYFGMQQKMQLRSRAQNKVAQYVAAVQEEKAKELSETEGLRTVLRDQVQTQGDAAFLARLVPRFSPRRHPVRMRQTKAPPQE
jgi:hypothetical protein